MRKKAHRIGEVSLDVFDEDARQSQANAAAVAAARGVVQPGGPIPPLTPIGRLGDVELSWIVAEIVAAWIGARAKQAAASNLDTEQMIRTVALDPDPWDAGAVMAILPELAEAPIDWSQPLAQWPRETMIEFLLTATQLVRKAVLARGDEGDDVPRRRRIRFSDS